MTRKIILWHFNCNSSSYLKTRGSLKPFQKQELWLGAEIYFYYVGLTFFVQNSMQKKKVVSNAVCGGFGGGVVWTVHGLPAHSPSSRTFSPCCLVAIRHVSRHLLCNAWQWSSFLSWSSYKSTFHCSPSSQFTLNSNSINRTSWLDFW